MPADQPTPDPIILGAALRYASRGLRVIPIHPGTKRPVGDNWPEHASNDPDTIRRWWKQNSAYGVGIATGWYGDRCIFVVDVDDGVDPKTGRVKEGSETLADLEAAHHPLPDTVEGQSGGGGRHLFFWAPVEIHNDQAGLLGVDLDLRGVGGQVVAEPTIHPDTHRPYVWVDGHDPVAGKIAQAPAWLVSILTQPVDEPSRPSSRPRQNGEVTPGDRFNDTTDWPTLLTADGATFLGARIDRRTSSTYELWARPGADHTSATLYYGGTDLLKVFSSNWPDLETGGVYDRFGYYTRTQYGGDFAAAAAYLARKFGDRDIRQLAAAAGQPAASGETQPDNDTDGGGGDGGAGSGALVDGHQPTDAGNSDRFVAHADGRVRYIAAWGKWRIYRDGRWVDDHLAAEVTELACGVARNLRRIAGQTPGRAGDQLWAHAKRLEKAATVAAMLHLSRGKPGILTDHEAFDADPNLLNVANGTVDLRTGQLRPHNPEDLLAMQTPAAYEEDATAPLWDQCLTTWQPDADVLAFLQTVAGTAITGYPLDRVLVNVGHGANGKSVFFGVLRRLLGEYATEAHKSLVVEERHEQHETVVADLYRRRLVLAPETRQTDKLSEEQVKNLTGGDRLKARRMREDRWAFDPSHTLVMHTNYRPRIAGTDEGIWRRVLLVDWPTTIPETDRDPDLIHKLDAERAGILRWLVDGARRWLDAGRRLELPPSVAAATGAYRLSEDQVGRFIADRCVVGATDAFVAASDLTAAYETWCQGGGEAAMTPNAFGRELTGRGFPTDRGERGARVRRGIELDLYVDDDDDDDSEKNASRT